MDFIGVALLLKSTGHLRRDVKIKHTIFRLDALAKALSVIATATWLAGWLGVRHTPVLYQNG